MKNIKPDHCDANLDSILNMFIEEKMEGGLESLDNLEGWEVAGIDIVNRKVFFERILLQEEKKITEVKSKEEAKSWFLSNSSGSVTCVKGEDTKEADSYRDAEKFFDE